jgi:hypothetical protein
MRCGPVWYSRIVRRERRDEGGVWRAVADANPVLLADAIRPLANLGGVGLRTRGPQERRPRAACESSDAEGDEAAPVHRVELRTIIAAEP